MMATTTHSWPPTGGPPVPCITPEETLEFLNEELSLLGIQTLEKLPQAALNAAEDHGGSNAVDPMLRALFQLLELQRRNVISINDLETEKRTSRGEMERLGRQLQQLQQQQTALKQSAAEAKEKERRAEAKIKELAKLLNAEREEKKKLFQAMQYKEKQFVHESRKNEREMTRLKEHLQQMDRGEISLIPPKIEIINDLKRPGGRRRSTWSNLSSSLTKEEEALYSVVVANFGERQKQLLAENASLRRALGSRRGQLQGVGEYGEVGDAGVEGSDEPWLQLPLHLLSLGGMEGKAERVENALPGGNEAEEQPPKSHLHIPENTRQTDVSPSSSEDVKQERQRLVAKLDYYEETIERQAKMIERLAVGNSFATSTLADSSCADSSSLDPPSSLNLSLAELEREKEDLARRKKEVADEALNLAKERLRLREEHCRLVTPLPTNAAGVQSVLTSSDPQSSTHCASKVASSSARGAKPSDNAVLADYLVDAAKGGGVALAITNDAPTLLSAAPSSGASSSGRSTALTSVSSLTRLGTSLDATPDDVGAFV